jgi:hypothetical protein
MKLMDSFYTSTILPDSYESDDDFKNAKDITVDAPAQQRTFHYYNDNDIIKLDLTGFNSNTKLIIATHKLSVDTITHIILLDSSQRYVKSGDFKGYDSINFTCENPGIFYIIATTYDNPGDYTIDVKIEP